MSETGLLRAPREILFGAGAVDALGRVVARLGQRVLVCTDDYLAGAAPGRRTLAALRTAGLDVHMLTTAFPELPKANVEETIALARAYRPDVVVGLGGGSCIDLAKLVALGLSHPGPLDAFYGEKGVPGPVLPLVAVPTTAGTGSEVTPVAVLGDPERELKVGISSRELIPWAAVCDPVLTHGAPPHVTAYAGIDALAHAIEAYCTTRAQSVDAVADRIFTGANALTDGFALQAVELLAGGLRGALADEPAGRAATMQGSLAAGLAFGTAGTAAAHALQYPLGARTKTPHGLGVGLLLPFVMRFIMPASETRLAAVATAMGAGDTPADAIDAVRTLAHDLGLPSSLEAIGVQPEEIAPMARQAVGIDRLIRNSPRPLDAGDAEAILAAALHGDLERLDLTTPETQR
ncbi:iron-containing alcohol dehydrogenase [Conexibacter sp. CPCC 206217]|uniref:iron-containing alcohol dehydrogenase n=1 Tax=Conexibacter sp. CPCC 206217 TaxID=3064574 RepID=UPI00271672C2|nr:iron-containing alcohol dehydrogenase [Conexibacter sp. CPCC 206217]MDO8210224.1 iron-containing alcohol dehydrogenase [Conexibacter sp. CPCC 206217]